MKHAFLLVDCPLSGSERTPGQVHLNLQRQQTMDVPIHYMHQIPLGGTPFRIDAQVNAEPASWPSCFFASFQAYLLTVGRLPDSAG